MQCLHLTRGEAPSIAVTAAITGSGNSSNCYVTINGTNYISDASNIEVHTGDQIVFGVYGHSSTYYGNVTINGTTVLTASSRVTETYTYTVPKGIRQILITLSYTSTSKRRNGRITVTTSRQSSSETSAWSVVDISGASYNFTKNSSGYYESNNQNISNSAALCRVKLNIKATATITFKCINFAEDNFDYGLLGNLDKSLSTSVSDVTTNVEKSFKGSSRESVQTYVYNAVSVGKHYIDVKFVKDNSNNYNNDSLQFTVEITT